jgi:hypothetical protein
MVFYCIDVLKMKGIKTRKVCVSFFGSFSTLRIVLTNFKPNSDEINKAKKFVNSEVVPLLFVYFSF